MSDKIAFAEADNTIDLELFQKLQEQMNDNAVGIISARFKKFFDEFPEVEAVVWTQYAPYFNDGDPCVFNVHELNIKLKKDEEAATDSEDDEDEDDDYYDDDDDYRDYAYDSDIEYGDTSPVALAAKELNKFSETFENLFEEAFGSDSLVICTKDGFEVRDYEHD